MARRAVEAASEKQAVDILLLDTRGVCSFADYFVLCSGESDRQIEAIRREIDDALSKEGKHSHRMEGTPDSGWLLMDFGDVVVHIFAPTEREFYRLESVWSQATPVLRIQ